jgi:dolichol-phosphate mannosyltransferase
MKKFSIILPCLNELENLKLLIPHIKKKYHNYDIEFIVVDDNSNDGTDFFFKKKRNKIKYIKRTKNLNLGKSVEVGIKNSTNKKILVMDSDFNHSPRDIKKFLKYLDNKEYKFISGSRFKSGGFGTNYTRHILSKLYSLILSNLLLMDLTELLSGFYLIDKSIFYKLKNRKKIFKGYGEYYIKLLISLSKINEPIKEIPVIYDQRKFGKSKSKFLIMAVNYFYQSIKFKYFTRK